MCGLILINNEIILLVFIFFFNYEISAKINTLKKREQKISFSLLNYSFQLA